MQNVQPMQAAQSSFFHNQQPLQQTGFYQAQQANTSTLQVSFHHSVPDPLLVALKNSLY